MSKRKAVHALVFHWAPYTGDEPSIWDRERPPRVGIPQCGVHHTVREGDQDTVSGIYWDCKRCDASFMKWYNDGLVRSHARQSV